MTSATLPAFSTGCVSGVADDNLGAECRSNSRSDTNVWHGRTSCSATLASSCTCLAARAENDGLSAESRCGGESWTGSLDDLVARRLAADLTARCLASKRSTSNTRAIDDALGGELRDCRRCDDARVTATVGAFNRLGVCVEGGGGSLKYLCAVSVVSVVTNELRCIIDGLICLIRDFSSVGSGYHAVFAIVAIVIFGHASVVDHDGYGCLASCVDRLRVGPSKRPGGVIRRVPTAIARDVCGEDGTSRVCLAVRDVRRVGRDTIHCRAPSDDGRWVDRYAGSRFTHHSAEHGTKICGIVGRSWLIGCDGLSASPIGVVLVNAKGDALQDSNINSGSIDTVSCVCGRFQNAVVSRSLEVRHALANR